MRYFSTNQQSRAVGFKEALFNGLAPDRGLYIPESIPEFDPAFFGSEMTYCELAAEMIQPFVSENISSAELMDICNAAFTFDIPLVCLIDDIYVLELFHTNIKFLKKTKNMSIQNFFHLTCQLKVAAK